jgi:hypothetical protein
MKLLIWITDHTERFDGLKVLSNENRGGSEIDNYQSSLRIKLYVGKFPFFHFKWTPLREKH